MSNGQDIYNNILVDRLDPDKVQPVRPVGGGDASAANQTALNALVGGLTETPPANDTASSGLNGRLARIAQRLTSLISQLPATLGVKGQAVSLPTTVAQDKTSWVPLTAPGVTSAFSMTGYKHATLAVNIASIDTSVTLRVEGNVIGTEWFNLNADNTDTTFTANGIYAFVVEATLDNIRLNFVSETGGTSAVINGTVRLSA